MLNVDINLYNHIADYAFSNANPGYKPTVQESPNGDGVWDTEKKYAHIAPKYFGDGLPTLIHNFYYDAVDEATRISRLLKIPEEFYPGEDSTLRVLEYPPGATTAPHLDFDLFTISLFRDDVESFKYLDGSDQDEYLLDARQKSPGIHFGEMMTELTTGRVPATNHEVVGTDKTQHSMVFFIIPSFDAKFPSGQTVGEWLEERKSRSRR